MNTAIKDLQQQIETKVTEYNALTETTPAPQLRPLTEEIKALREQLSAQIAAGAERCPVTGEVPTGMPQSVLVKGKPMELFEVGSSVLRAQGFTPELAVQAWNSGDYRDPEVARFGLRAKEKHPHVPVRELIRACRTFRKADSEERAVRLKALEQTK